MGNLWAVSSNLYPCNASKALAAHLASTKHKKEEHKKEDLHQDV
jgi:hypothetical protein